MMLQFYQEKQWCQMGGGCYLKMLILKNWWKYCYLGVKVITISIETQRANIGALKTSKSMFWRREVSWTALNVICYSFFFLR